MAEKLAPKSSLCTTAPSPQTKSGKENSSRLFLFISFYLFFFWVFLGQGAVNGRSLLIQSLCVYLQIIFSVSECFPSPCLL